MQPLIINQTSASRIQDSLVLQGKCSMRHVFKDSILDSIADLSSGQAMGARSRADNLNHSAPFL